MSLDDDDKKILGGIGGGFGGAVIGAKAVAALSPVIALTGPFSPLAAAAVFGASTVAGAVTGSRRPAAGTLTALSAVSGVPIPEKEA
jgi:hypothetical protein